MLTCRIQRSAARIMAPGAAFLVWFMLVLPTTAPALPSVPALSAGELEELQRGEAVVTTESMGDGLTGVTGRIRVQAAADQVWDVITDYDHHWQFLPNVKESGLLSDNGREQEMFQTGRTGVLLFRKTVHIQLRLKGERPRRLVFRQTRGDFKVYNGEWRISDDPLGRGVLLTFVAEIKPDFFAPAMFVRKVQKKDLPGLLNAMKKRAEHLQPPAFKAE
ncbi:hypothetical protein Plut_1938 [Pelodictyon luteolum DSM 273]|uniref:Coenzyme Q-binding protein COQ10 START domain-containing protein n=2 Tax=Pelodictyon luteolum TaxID=1100 RepID=Q3B1K1_CHLL3|nr:hypothetical protein Plut_1938 [Pelodictyon luteolum DSM 273]